MSLDPRLALGRWRVAEALVEASVPSLGALGGWIFLERVLGAPTAARPLTGLELGALFGAAAALTGWMAGRQLHLAGRKSPWSPVVLGSVYIAVALIVLPGLATGSFAEACAESAGEVVLSQPLRSPSGAARCRIGGVADNPYLPGALLRPSWSGDTPPWLWAVALASGALGALGLRDRRVRPSAMGRRLFALLRYAPAGGTRAGVGPPPIEEGRIIACANPTLWGEVCGQIYSADRVFQAGEACARCGMAFQRAEREITLKVVSLFSADSDVLNGLEKADTVSWQRDEPMTPDARVSGAERWVQLGVLTLPDVVSAATALAIAHERLEAWGAASSRAREAAAIAQARASRVSAWLWFGALSHRLTYARPTERAVLALGATRLRELVPEGGEEVWLQLDVGLLPVELRYGFRKARPGRAPELQNSKTDLWLPVAPAELPRDRQGVWIPRVEGEALRVWLSTERLRDDPDAGGAVPLPYLPWRPGPEGAPPPDPFADATPEPGSLDYVRSPLDKDGAEPTLERSLGDSIADWDWMEQEQIGLLRRQCLVLMSRGATP